MINRCKLCNNIILQEYQKCKLIGRVVLQTSIQFVIKT